MTLDFKTKGLLVSDWPYLLRIFQVTFNSDKSKICAYEILYICHRLVVWWFTPTIIMFVMIRIWMTGNVVGWNGNCTGCIISTT